MYGLVVRFELLAGHERAFDELVKATLEGIQREEPGTSAYLVHRRPGADHERIFYELYEDEDAHRVHGKTPAVQRFMRERGDHLRAEPEVWKLDSVSGVLRDGVEIPR